MPNIAYSGGYAANPYYYPTISGPIGDDPSSPTGGVSTVPPPNIYEAPPITYEPTLPPIAPDAPAPDTGTACNGCDAASESPIPGAATGAPLPPGGSGMGAEGAATGGAAGGCQCQTADEVKAFFRDVPPWVWALLAGAFLFGRR